MDDKQRMAVRAYADGCNCAQSVIAAYTEELGLEEKEALRLMEAFGGGIAGMQEVCGAFSAACAVMGYLNSDGSREGRTKKDSYAKIRRLAEVWKEKYGSVRCFDIMHGQPPQHMKCGMKVRDGVKMVELFRKGAKELTLED